MPDAAISAAATHDLGDVTIDAFLGGRVEAVQPAGGHHRAGLEAVLLAASVPTRQQGAVVDLGSGVGVAGFCIAARCIDARVTLVERDETAVACARAGLGRPANSAFAGRIDVVETDIAARKGLPVGQVDAVVFNPPFYRRDAATASPARSRAGAHMLDEDGLDPWFRAAAALSGRDGTVTVIFRADGLDSVIAAAAGRFGGLEILPIAPRQDMPAHRVLVRGKKGSRAPLSLLSPLVLHDDAGNDFRPEIDAILRDGAELSAVVPCWNNDRDHTC